NVVGELHLWIRGKGSSKVPIDYSANLVDENDDALRKVARDAVLALTGGPPKGTVHVKASDVAAAQVFVDGQPLGALVSGGGSVLVGPGARRVQVRAAGYTEVESSVVVKPNATSEVSVTPVKLETSEPGDWRKAAGIAGIGVGVAAGVVGLIGTLQVNSIDHD